MPHGLLAKRACLQPIKHDTVDKILVA